MTRIEKLNEAARLLNEVWTTLNRQKSACDCCHLVRYDNFAEYQLAVEIAAARHKILSRYIPVIRSLGEKDDKKYA